MPSSEELEGTLFEQLLVQEVVVEAAPTIQSVSALTKEIKDILELRFAEVTVEGEISNYTNHRSGHRYWTLKDANAQISCVFWKSRPLSFEIESGQKVVCRGRVSLYAPRGNYQLDVYQIRPVGIGALQLAYEALFKKLQAEGLFEESRKRSIPNFPKRIGIVTSATGAAIHDILTVLRRRYPLADILFRPASVQGVGSELQVAQAIREFNLLSESERPDVLIVGRGGGSLEDLWTFNEEAVARAIFASTIPIVSAVGHEVDITIADFCADLRAPTPTAAAELITPDRNELLGIVNSLSAMLDSTMNATLLHYRSVLQSHSSGYGLKYVLSQSLERHKQTLITSTTRMHDRLERLLERSKFDLERHSLKLAAIDPKKVLRRGYAIALNRDGSVLQSIHSIKSGEAFTVVLSDGAFDAAKSE